MLAILMGAGSALCVFLLSLMLAKPKRALGDDWIAAWLVVYCAYFSASGLSQALGGEASFIFSLIGQTAVALLAPAQFLHAWRITAGETRRGLGYAGWALLIAAAVLVLPLITQLRVESGALVARDPIPWLFLLPPAAIIATLIYPIAILHRLQQYPSRLKLRLTDPHKAELAWTRIWAVSTIVLLVAQFGVFVLSVTGAVPVPLHVGALLLGQVLQVAFVGRRGVAETRIFSGETFEEGTGRDSLQDLKAACDDFTRLEALFATASPHLDSELTAQMLADQLGWAPYRLTAALRLGGGTSFIDFVNRARVKTLKRLALEPNNAGASLLGLAFDAGFGSKSAFYEAFRTVEGVPPARWRAQNPPRQANSSTTRQ